MKTKLQALISEQKALTARFEELVNKTTAKPYAFIGNEAKAEAIQSFLGAKSACFDSNSIYLNINGECSEFALVPAFMPMIAQFYTIINLNEQPYFFEELNNTDPKKVYIKGHPTRGAEVIKMLKDLGGWNGCGYEGIHSHLGYFITDSGYINSASLDCFKEYTELHLPEEVSTENTQNTDIKVGDWYLLDEPCLKCEISDRMKVEPFVIDKISASFDSDVAIAKFADGTQCDLYKLRDKFHKVEPPTEEVELLAGQVYSTKHGDISLAKEVISNTNVRIFCVLYNRGYLSINSDNGYVGIGATALRLATPEQRKQLFDALEKEGKHFDKENMRLIDVEEWSCEQGLPIIVRNETTNWRVDIFHSYDAVDAKYPFLCAINDDECRPYKYAIPYNDQTKKLIGTTDNTDKHYKFVNK